MRDLNIAYGNSRQAKFWSNKTIQFAELCDRLRTPIRTSETAEEYSKMPKLKRDAIKDKGGFVGGHLRDNRRQLSKIASRSMLAFDSDCMQKEFLENIGDNIPNKGCYYTTHSHVPESPRGRILIPVTRDMTSEEFQAVARYYAADNGFLDMVDPCSFSPHQLMYWPTCPSNGEYLFDVIDGDWLNPDEVLNRHPDWRDCSLLPTTPEESKAVAHSLKHQKDPLEKSGVVGAFCRTYSITAAIKSFLSDIYALSAVDGRYDYIAGSCSAGVVVYDDKFVYSHHSTDPASEKLLNAFDLVRVHKFGDADEKKSFDAMCAFAANDENVKLQIARERIAQADEDFSPAEADDEWQKKFQYEARSTVLKNNLHNITLILQNDPNLKNIVFNQQLDGMEIKGTVPWSHPSKYWRDADDAQLISYIDSHYGTFSQRNYDIAVTKVTDDRSYHPIREFLDSLPEWDKTPRVDTLLIDYLGAVDNPYVRAVTRKTLCAAVCRVQKPGVKFDTMLVLNGPQGIGKSTLIAKLAGEWFSDSLNLGDTKDKTAAEKLQGYWILEIGELAGLRKAEVETLRSFLSRQNDIYRASFGKRTTPHPRQCIFFGTTNAESGYLRDTTGNRRFYPIKTPGSGAKHTWDITEDDVKQIWAEVLVYVKNGEELHLTPEVEALAKEEQREALESDEREGLVREYLDTLLPENWVTMDLFERRNFLAGSDVGNIGRVGTVRRTKVCNMEIWCELFGKEQGNLRRSESNELTAMLTKLGWSRQEKKERLKIYGPQIIFVPKPVLD